MRLERREERSRWLTVFAPIGAVLAALLLSGGLIALAGASPLRAYGAILEGAFGSRLALTETLARATPLIFTGLAAAIAFRAKVWNIGGEGQFYIGALAAAWAGSQNLLGLPSPLLIAGLMVVGALAGAVLLLAPVGMRLRFGVDEVVTTLLLNFVAVLFVSMMIEGPLKDPLAFGWPQSVPIEAEAELPKLVDRSRLHVGLLIAIAFAIVLQVVKSRMAFGLESTAVGLNPEASRFAGIPIGKTLLMVAAISGGLAGLAGVIEVIGVKGYVTTDLSPGYGYAGIIVAMLANLQPLGVAFAAIFAAVMFVGSDSMSRALGVPSFIADVTVALSLLTMLIALLLSSYRIRR